MGGFTIAAVVAGFGAGFTGAAMAVGLGAGFVGAAVATVFGAGFTGAAVAVGFGAGFTGAAVAVGLGAGLTGAAVAVGLGVGGFDGFGASVMEDCGRLVGACASAMAGDRISAAAAAVKMIRIFPPRVDGVYTPKSFRPEVAE